MATVSSSPSVVDGTTKGQKTEMLYGIYRKEAEDFMARQQFAKALKSFNLAIQLQPRANRALIGRSRCYMYIGKTFRAMQDAEQALSIDASSIDAVYQKAEILFLTGNYQLASVYYKRGAKLDPKSPRFQRGVQQCTEALNKFGHGAISKNKLSVVGDLSFFLNSKRRHTTLVDVSGEPSDADRTELPSAGFRDRHLCPLIRISRKSRFPQLHSFRPDELGERPVGEGGDVVCQPDEDTMRKILGELYGDRQYLQRLQTDLPKGRCARRDVGRLTSEALQFLHERSTLWGRQSIENPDFAPLPPPPASIPSQRLSYSRHCRRGTVLKL